LSLKNLDISYGFGGEPSTASVSFVYKKKECGETSAIPKISTFGESLLSGNTQIDGLLRNFVVTTRKDSKEAGFRTISYELVDREAKRLESIAVLVRGITAPPIGNSLDDFRRFFNAAEFGIGIGQMGDSLPSFNGKIAVIGQTFSVVSASVGDESATVYYTGGKLSHQTPRVLTPDLIDAINENAKNCSLQYGYYLSDFEKLLRMCGYEVNNFPKENNLMLLDFGGSLKDCVGSVASMFGMYWIVRGNVITFYTSAEISSFAVPNFNNDTNPNILSCSFSEDVLGRASVGVIVGNGDSEFDSKNFEFDGKQISLTFNYLDFADALKTSVAWIQNFLSFFKFAGNGEQFNKLFLSEALRTDQKKEGRMVEQPLFKKYYPKGKIKESPDGGYQSKGLYEIEDDIDNRLDLEKNNPFLQKYLDLYLLKDESGEEFLLPTETPIYDIVKNACEGFASIYISDPFSKSRKKRYAVTPKDGMTVSNAYLGSTNISEIPELASVYGILAALTTEKEVKKTIADLYEDTQAKKNNEAETILDLEESYFCVGIVDYMQYLESLEIWGKCQESVLDSTSNSSGQVVKLGAGNSPYFATSKEESEKLKNVLNQSKVLYEEVLKDVKKEIKTKATEIQDEDQTTVEDEDLSIYSSFYKSFKTRLPNVFDLSTISVLKFEGNLGEAEHLASNFSNLVGPAFNLKTSSVSYSGLVIPDDTPVLTDSSFSFSGGSIETSLSYSNKEFMAESESVILSSYSANTSNNVRRSLNTRQRGFLGIH